MEIITEKLKTTPDFIVSVSDETYSAMSEVHDIATGVANRFQHDPLLSKDILVLSTTMIKVFNRLQETLREIDDTLIQLKHLKQGEQ
jgi:hypothetical protein